MGLLLKQFELSQNLEDFEENLSPHAEDLLETEEPTTNGAQLSQGSAIATPSTASTLQAQTSSKVRITSEQKGYVYCVHMLSSRVHEITPQIAQKIRNLEGRKGGRVVLGWKRKQGSYFHFVLPKAKKVELLGFLETYGSLQFTPAPHSLVMPEGEERYILWVRHAP